MVVANWNRYVIDWPLQRPTRHLDVQGMLGRNGFAMHRSRLRLIARWL